MLDAERPMRDAQWPTRDAQRPAHDESTLAPIRHPGLKAHAQHRTASHQLRNVRLSLGIRDWNSIPCVA
jgi:hypothetical protein